MSYTFTPIPVTVEGQKHLLTLPAWSMSSDDAAKLGLDARLITAEEAADNPNVLQHLKNMGFGGMKPIA